MNTSPRLVSVKDRNGDTLYPNLPISNLDRERLTAQRIMNRCDRNMEIQGLVHSGNSPSLVPCPNNPHHIARVLLGSKQAWCPKCQKIFDQGIGDSSETRPSNWPLFAAIVLLGILVIMGWMAE